MEAQNLKTANSFGPRKVCGNSTTQEFHKGLQGPRADLQEWPDNFKLQGPLFGVTTYAVINDLFRINFLIMEISTKWFQ